MTEKPKGLAADILTYNDRAARYVKFIKSIDHKRFLTGLPLLDSVIRGVSPGEVLTIIAYSGTYKTAYLQNLQSQFANTTRQHQMFFSMEMPVETVFEREIQMATGLTGYDVEQVYKRMDNECQELHNMASDKGGKFMLCVEKPRLSLQQIEKYYDVAKAKYGDIGSIGIDYLGLMGSDAKNTFEKMVELSYGVKDLAKRLMVPVILLGQVHRGYAASKGVEIEMDAAKGGGDIEAGADFMFGLYMVGNDLILKVLKNRKGRTNVYFKMELYPECFKFTGCQPWEPPPPPAKKIGGVV